MGRISRAFLVLAEALGEELQQRFRIDNVLYLPLHPPFAKYVTRDAAKVRATIGVPAGHVVFSILGEARRGKGIDVLLQALDQFSATICNTCSS